MTQAHLLAGFAFVLGAVVGSFLNACIHRLPRNISIGEPKRSFCPHCKTTIPWYHNLPIASWLWLRGKCASCGAPISPRYILVEILTGVVFLAIWLKFGLPLAPAYLIFAALLIVATFIDFEHYIIPDEITLGGAAAGLVLGTVLPGLMGVTIWWQGFLWSLGAAALGYGLLWLVVEGGKLAFGRKRIESEQPEPFRFEPDEENPRLVVGDEIWPWEEIFSRPSDVLILEVEHAMLNGAAVSGKSVKVFYDRAVIDGKETKIEDVSALTGVLTAIVIPREAMGLGDVKFMACIGAFLGWKAVLFTIATSSVIGALIGGGMLLITRGRAGGKIPYGPYLALGAALWLICGPELVQWYLAALKPATP
jgi:leader peptidase (prepilin peptidase) / N-methyltransferase